MFKDFITDQEKELAIFCAEFDENGHDDFPEVLAWTVNLILVNPDIEILKIGIKSYAALVLMYAIEEGSVLKQKESLNSYQGKN